MTTAALITPAEAAASLGVSLSTVRALYRRGRARGARDGLPAVRLGHRTIRIPLHAVEALEHRRRPFFESTP